MTKSSKKDKVEKAPKERPRRRVQVKVVAETKPGVWVRVHCAECRGWNPDGESREDSSMGTCEQTEVPTDCEFACAHFQPVESWS